MVDGRYFGRELSPKVYDLYLFVHVGIIRRQRTAHSRLRVEGDRAVAGHT